MSNDMLPANPHEVARIVNELAAAQAARDEDNEGKARVCARRAAGWAITEYRRRLAFDVQGVTAYSHLQWAAQHPQLDVRIKAAAEALIERIDYDHALASGADALLEARVIIQHFLPEARLEAS